MDDLAIWYDNVGKYMVKSYRVKSERNKTPTVVTAITLANQQTNPCFRYLLKPIDYLKSTQKLESKKK